MWSEADFHTGRSGMGQHIEEDIRATPPQAYGSSTLTPTLSALTFTVLRSHPHFRLSHTRFRVSHPIFGAHILPFGYHIPGLLLSHGKIIELESR